MILLYLVGFLIVLRFARKSNEYEKVTRFEYFTLPVLSLVMIAFAWHEVSQHWLIFIVVLIVSALIGKYQTTSAQIKYSGQLNRRGLPEISLKKGRNYLIGWCLIVIIGFIGDSILNAELSWSNFMQAFFVEALRELVMVFRFTHPTEWFIWTLSAGSSITYTITLLYKGINRRRQLLARIHNE